MGMVRGESKADPVSTMAIYCDTCGNEFMVPNHEDFIPKFCCYYGGQFGDFVDEENDPEDYGQEESSW